MDNRKPFREFFPGSKNAISFVDAMFLIAICHSAVMLMTPWRGRCDKRYQLLNSAKSLKTNAQSLFFTCTKTMKSKLFLILMGPYKRQIMAMLPGECRKLLCVHVDKYFMITTLQHIWLWFAAECFSPTESSTTLSDIRIGMLNSQRSRFSSFRDRSTLHSLSVHLVQVLFIIQLTFSIFTWVEVIFIEFQPP